MIKWGIKWRDQRPVGVAIRKWRQIGVAIHQAAGEFWKQELLPQHFKPSAARKYRHAKRSLKYLSRKIQWAVRGRTWGLRYYGPVDLVWSGTTARAMTVGGSVRAYPSRATIVMQGPSYLTGNDGRGFRPNRFAGSKQPDKVREIKADTPEDHLAIMRVIEEEFDKQMAAIGPAQEETIT